MKIYRDSDYAVNKYANRIVYRFANGQTVTVTLDECLRKNTGSTETDFAELKTLSDEMHLMQVRTDNAQGKKILSFNSLEGTLLCAVPSPGYDYIVAEETAEKHAEQFRLVNKALSKLTDIQRKRYIQHFVNGRSLRKIASSEGTHFTSV